MKLMHFDMRILLDSSFEVGFLLGVQLLLTSRSMNRLLIIARCLLFDSIPNSSVVDVRISIMNLFVGPTNRIKLTNSCTIIGDSSLAPGVRGMIIKCQKG